MALNFVSGMSNLFPHSALAGEGMEAAVEAVRRSNLGMGLRLIGEDIKPAAVAADFDVSFQGVRAVLVVWSTVKEGTTTEVGTLKLRVNGDTSGNYDISGIRNGNQEALVNQNGWRLSGQLDTTDNDLVTGFAILSVTEGTVGAITGQMMAGNRTTAAHINLEFDLYFGGTVTSEINRIQLARHTDDRSGSLRVYGITQQ